MTATFGNLAAYLQTNLKRLLAYSTIAHAGYMMMGLAALTRDGAGAVLFYLIAYLFMNLGAFAVVAFLRNQTGSEELYDFRGMVRRAPLLTITLAVFLLSLLGMPPLAGFAAKFQIFRVLYQGGQMYSQSGHPDLGDWLYALLVIGGLNTVLSVVYYIKVMRVMILDNDPGGRGRPTGGAAECPAGVAVVCGLLAGVIFVIGILWNPLAGLSDRGVERFRERINTPPKVEGVERDGGDEVIAAADAARLEAVIRREGRSLLQYLSEAFPWSKTADDTTADKIRDFAPRSARPWRR